MLTAVIGDDGDDDDDANDINQGNHQDGDDDNDDNDDDDVECKLEDGIDEEDDDHDDDIKLSSDGLIDVLEADMDNEEEDAILSNNADAALVQMIEMRRQGRKHGLMKAKQRELLIRTRAIDILEVQNCNLHFMYECVCVCVYIYVCVYVCTCMSVCVCECFLLSDPMKMSMNISLYCSRHIGREANLLLP